MSASVAVRQRVRTPTVLQMEAVECGAAALSIILQYHGRIVPLEKVREACGVSRNGTKASAIVRAAQSFGLSAKGLRKEPAELHQLKLPFMVFWNFNHYLVVEGFRRGKVWVNDPGSGPRVISEHEFDQSFTGVVLTFEKAKDFEAGGRLPSMWSMLKPRLSGTGAVLTFLILAATALIVPGLVVPVLYKVFIDEVLISNNAAWLHPLVFAVMLASLLKGLLMFLQESYRFRMETKLALRSSSQFLWHVLRLPSSFFAQRWGNEIGARVELNDTVAIMLSAEIATNAVNVLLIGAYAALMSQYDPLLTSAVVCISGLNVLALRWVSRSRKDANLKLQQENGKLMATAMAGLQMIETLKATGTESDFYSKWAGYQAKVVNAQQRLGSSTQLLTALPPFLGALNVAAVLGIGGVRVVDGLLTVGMLIAFQNLASSFSDPVNQLVNLGGKLQESEAHLMRLEDVMRYPTDADGKRSDAASIETWRLKGHVELRDITFGYSRLEPPLIRGLSLKVRPGERVALVGASGSGKSTVAKLVCGLYKPWSGEILFDGKRREEIPREVLCNSLAMVDQDIFLFGGTITDNLTMWDTTVHEHTRVEAAKDAQIHDDIVERPNGYDYTVEEGGRNFSGGQRQRLEIARALVSNPRVLVLDEATSALDPRVEGMVDDCLRRRGCASIIIAHRLSTIRDCDEIIVLDQGEVVQRGTHLEMIRTDGPYSRLIKAH